MAAALEDAHRYLDGSVVAVDALQIARATNSGRTSAILVDVAQTLTPWRSQLGPREFREAMLA